jgi:hypothetical protein
MLWMIVTRSFCQTEILRDFPCTLKAEIFKKKILSFYKKAYLIFFITLERSKTRHYKFESILEIIKSVVSSQNWDLLVDCTSRDGWQMLDAGVHLSDKLTLLMKTHRPFQTQYKIFYQIRCFFLFLIYQKQAIGLSFKKLWCIWRSHLCPLKLICHIKDVCLDRSLYFLLKIFQTRDIIHSEKIGICSDGNRKLGFAC